MSLLLRYEKEQKVLEIINKVTNIHGSELGSR